MVSDLNIFAQKWSKIAASKKVFVYGFFYLFTFEVPFKCLFAPTSQSWMSKTFKDSKSLGKSIGKKWSQIWTFLIKNGLKSPRQKKKVFTNFFLDFFTFEVPFKRFCAPISRSRMSKLFRDSEFLGKSFEKKWSQIWTILLKNGLKLLRQKKFLQIFFPLFTLFKRPMSKLVLFSESLGKTNGKKWSQI